MYICRYVSKRNSVKKKAYCSEIFIKTTAFEYLRELIQFKSTLPLVGVVSVIALTQIIIFFKDR